MKKLIICLLILAGFAPGAIFAADILVIANKNAVDSELTQKEVKKMFLGKLRQWSDYSKVRPAVPKNSDIFKPFVRQYLHKSTSQYTMYWKRMIFTGKGIPPKSFKSDAELIAYVAETKGSIACVSSESIPEGGNSEIKVIKIK